MDGVRLKFQESSRVGGGNRMREGVEQKLLLLHLRAEIYNLTIY
jgi:hypothetical protein